MSPIFWVDVIALGAATITATSLALLALGAGLRSALNVSFALFTLMEAIWATASILARFSLWLDKGDPTDLAELATLAFVFMLVLLLLFTAHYVNRHTRQINLAVILGLVAVGGLAVPLFGDQLVFNARLESNGSTTMDLSSWSLLLALIPAGFMFWSLRLFWQERHRLEEPYLAFSVILLAAGFFVGGIVQIPFPVLSVTNTLSVCILGYGVISRQLFNPLRARTLELQREVAERMRTEEALRETEKRFRSFVEQSHDGIVLMDVQGNVVEWNPSQEHITGLSRAQVMGTPLVNALFQVFPAEEKNLAVYDLQRKLMQEFLDTGQAPWLGQVLEREIQRFDATRRTVQSLVFPIETAGGFAAGGIWRDLTEHIQAEKALRENQRRLELALKGADYALWDWDVQTGRVTRNERWPIMLGYGPDELEPHIDAWRSRCHPDDLPVTEAALDAHFKGHTLFYEAEYRVRTKSGDWIWIYDRGQTVERDEKGTPRRVIGIEQDITGRKRIEEALIRSEQERTAILDSMSELVVYQNTAMEIIWTNRAAGQSVGMLPEQLVGRHCYEIWHQQNVPCAGCPVVQVFATGENQEAELASPDGRLWHIRGYPVRDVSGGIEGIVEVAQDVTNRTQAEQQQREFMMERERANVLHRFLSSASHDLKTPLTTIKLSLHLLRVADLETRQRHVEILDRQTARLERLLEDMLSMSRLDSEMEFKFEPLDLNLLLRDMVARYETQASRNNQSLTFTGSSNLPPVPAAKIHLAQAINHLIVNALQYTAEAGRIVVKTCVVDRQAVIEIQDDGMGISDEDLPHIFEHFYRADKARSTNEGGTGLGLTIAKRVIEAHQGRIEVESEPGTGSCFRVWLPFRHD